MVGLRQFAAFSSEVLFVGQSLVDQFLEYVYIVFFLLDSIVQVFGKFSFMQQLKACALLGPMHRLKVLIFLLLLGKSVCVIVCGMQRKIEWY